eukprot:GEMP01077396.1.p1 GENE.GEMP01077396.1~~GEMP01077396.1.p1  ORF type:complete len:102 (+),score=3.23 GEMP01077396.1:783-1088(+)
MQYFFIYTKYLITLFHLYGAQNDAISLNTPAVQNHAISLTSLPQQRAGPDMKEVILVDPKNRPTVEPPPAVSRLIICKTFRLNRVPPTSYYLNNIYFARVC